MAGSVVVFSLMLFLVATDVVGSLIKRKKKFTGLTMAVFYIGVELFLIYFGWFCISEMLEVRFFGPVPPFKESKLFISACVLVGASLTALFGEALYTRLKTPDGGK